MHRFFNRTVLALCVLALVIRLWPAGELRHGPGIVAPNDPRQIALDPLELPERDGWHLQAVALYDLTARVLGTRRYWDDGKSLAPVDVAIAWGQMSDETVLDRLSISQGNRFFFYEWHGQPPLPPQEMTAHAANMHVISATDEVAGEVAALRRGEVVTMRGYLVNASRPDGARWSTSLSRTDSGKGACELFYLEEVRPEKAVPMAAASPAAR